MSSRVTGPGPKILQNFWDLSRTRVLVFERSAPSMSFGVGAEAIDKTRVAVAQPLSTWMYDDALRAKPFCFSHDSAEAPDVQK